MAHIQIRISHDEKKQAKQVLDKLGLTFSSAIKLFFRQMVRVQGLPFTVSVTEIEDIQTEENKEVEKKPVKEIIIDPKPISKFSNMLQADFSVKKIDL